MPEGVNLGVGADVVGPATSGSQFALDAKAGHLLVHLDLDQPVDALLVDGDEVGGSALRASPRMRRLSLLVARYQTRRSEPKASENYG